MNIQVRQQNIKADGADLHQRIFHPRHRSHIESVLIEQERQGQAGGPKDEQHDEATARHSDSSDNPSCSVCDGLGNVAETATSNIFLAKDGVVKTPIPNGTFLNGITRQRTIGLLRAAGATVVETVLRYEDFLAADEIFTSGNASKVMPVLKIDDRSLQPGPFYTRARKAYWDFAHAG